MATRATKATKGSQLASFLDLEPVQKWVACPPTKRNHATGYHRPRLLDHATAPADFLAWFDSTAQNRDMPWRKDCLSPIKFAGSEAEFRAALAKRAYEVWVSEIMLQQTRVSVVIPYFDKWITKWPTVEALAAASHDDVLAAWKGLGYYSRATRLHEAAQQIVNDMNGELPADVESLLKIKGIGRYTAGAISSIAFGKAVPLLDGNVARVLCRQMGLYARAKDKKIEDVLWKAADILVKHAAQSEIDATTSDIPGRWNQGLMELGSTICTPKPKCGQCPIRSTCSAYAEGSNLDQDREKVKLRSVQVDIEDLCNLCEPLQLEEAEEAAYDIMIEQDPTLNPSTKGRKRAGTSSTLTSRPVKASKPAQTAQRSLRDFASFASLPAAKAEPAASKVAVNEAAQIVGYCSLFPKREQKKLVPEQECIVCIIQRQSGEGAQYLIEQRPPKGLLASLWQFPTYTVSTKAEIKAKQRKEASLQFVQDTFAFSTDVKVKLLEERGSVMHVFSHLKLEMFIHLFILNCSDELALAIASKDLPKRSWVDKEGVDQATLSTGMKRCWEKLS